MLEKTLTFLFCVSIFLSAGCASTGTVQQGVYRTELGTAPSGETVQVVRDVIQNRYGYTFDREVMNEEQIRFTTEWKEHLLNEEEKQNDIRAVRSRLEVRARPSSRSGGGVRDYRIDFEAVYQTRSGGRDGEWTSSVIPESRSEYFGELSRLIKNQLEGGLRSM